MLLVLCREHPLGDVAAASRFGSRLIIRTKFIYGHRKSL